jgi:hypothetical protein
MIIPTLKINFVLRTLILLMNKNTAIAIIEVGEDHQHGKLPLE